jgi:hypothetical protein
MDSTADKEISRRRFLQAGTGAVLAAGGLAGAAAALPAPITAEGADGAPGPLRKCISLSGPAPVRSGRHPNDYCYWGTPDYFRQSGTTWVKLWVSWADLQPEYRPRSRAESWFDLNMAPLGKAWLWRLDRQVRAANDDGLGVILSLYHAFPRWANGAEGDDPDSARSASQRLPRDLSPTCARATAARRIRSARTSPSPGRTPRAMTRAQGTLPARASMHSRSATSRTSSSGRRSGSQRAWPR